VLCTNLLSYPELDPFVPNKVRERLLDFPMGLVPEHLVSSVTSIVEAWIMLKKTF
jgi:hypothetical protein